MEIFLHPTYDSSNTVNPPKVKVMGNDRTIEFTMEWMDRTIAFNREDLEKVCEIFRGKE